MRAARFVASGTAVLLALAAAGCAGSGPVDAPVAAPAGPAETSVAIGASETIGEGADRPIVEAWPHVLHRTALERGAVFVNAGDGGATVAEALDEQLPLAQELGPSLVTVWLNVNDLRASVPVATYERQLAELVEGLRADGAEVLVANTPAVEHLPAYRNLVEPLVPPDEVTARVDAYNEAIARVAAATGAEVVDLHAASLAAVDDGTFPDLVADDGFHPSTEGHARVAELFADAL
jgi:lysophospholipase L1-like esterase